MNEQLVLGAAPVARVADHASSHHAARRVSAGAQELEQAIVDVLNAWTVPLTPEAIALHVDALCPGRWLRGTVESAVSRARRRGLIVPVGVGVTSRGSRAVTYQAVA